MVLLAEAPLTFDFSGVTTGNREIRAGHLAQNVAATPLLDATCINAPLDGPITHVSWNIIDDHLFFQSQKENTR